MSIYLIRHGETNWNLEGKLQGREDIPLNETGREQAKLCGQALQRLNIRTIFTSPLSRAKVTAEIIAEHIGGKDVIVEPGLIERDFGALAGVTYDKKKYFDTFGIEEGIEPWDQLQKRLLDCIRNRAEEYRSEDIIMISHGAAINSVLSALTAGDMGSGKTRLKNACINVIRYQDGDLALEQYNLTAAEFININ